MAALIAAYARSEAMGIGITVMAGDDQAAAEPAHLDGDRGGTATSGSESPPEGPRMDDLATAVPAARAAALLGAAVGQMASSM